jgi:hypothetical protein
MLEHLQTQEEYSQARDYIAGVAGNLGIPL